MRSGHIRTYHVTTERARSRLFFCCCYVTDIGQKVSFSSLGTAENDNLQYEAFHSLY